MPERHPLVKSRVENFNVQASQHQLSVGKKAPTTKPDELVLQTRPELSRSYRGMVPHGTFS
eukprot:scaffold55077_cov66-Phaeocystis_antarctica.AAC.4